MPRIDDKAGRWLFLSLAVATVLFGFTPISHVLLRLVNGSFAPSPYTSLAPRRPSEATAGIKQGVPVQVELINRSGRARTYRWQAPQTGALISTGLEKLANGQAETIIAPTNHASSGRLRVALDGTDIYVSVPVLKS